MVLLFAAVAAAGCAQMKYERAQRDARTHPVMEECWMDAGPEGAALVDCFEKPLVTDARECVKEQVGQLSPDEKRDLERCVLQARESDRQPYYSTPHYNGWILGMF